MFSESELRRLLAAGTGPKAIEAGPQKQAIATEEHERAAVA